ncbi:MAG: hypothetical protein ACC657_18830 [Thiohalomonadales bacterium]
MVKNLGVSFLLVFISSCFISVSTAAEVEVSGYVTLFAGYTDEPDRIYSDFVADNSVDFTDKSHAGVQLNSDIYKDIEFSMTLLMEGIDEFAAHADWFYATYTANNNNSLRFGRLKVPFFMVSNYIDIGHAYPWVAPPQEVYNVKLVKSVDGLEYIYQTDVFDNVFSFDMFVGSGKNHQNLSASYIHDSGINTATPPYKTGDTIKFKSNGLVGFETSLASDFVTLRLGHYETKVDSEDFSIVKAKMAFSSLGIIVNWNKFILYSEYVNRQSDESIQHIFSDQMSSYITVGYRIHDLLSYVTLASIDKGKNKNKYGLMQESTSLGFRYDINPKMDIKLQASRINPKSESADVGRFGFFDDEIKGNTAMVYTMTIDMLF